MTESQVQPVTQRAAELESSGYRLDVRDNGFVVFHRNRLVYMAGPHDTDGAIRAGDTMEGNLLGAVVAAEQDKARFDHLAAFSIADFVPADGDLVLDMRTGLTGRAKPSGAGAVAVYCGTGEGTPIELRCAAADLAPLSRGMMLFNARVAFSNEDEVYGETAFRIVARSEEEAYAVAADAAALSVYDDERIPDRYWSVEIEPCEDSHLEDEPGAGGQAPCLG